MAIDRKTVDQKTIRHVARLSRLELDDAEMETFTSQLGRIVDYVEKLQELDVSIAGDDEPECATASLLAVPAFSLLGWTSQPWHMQERAVVSGALLRNDAPKGSLSRKDALEGAPSAGDGFFRVPPVIEDAGASE